MIIDHTSSPSLQQSFSILHRIRPKRSSLNQGDQQLGEQAETITSRPKGTHGFNDQMERERTRRPISIKK